MTQTVDSNKDEISLLFSQWDDYGKVGEQIDNDTGQPICKILFDNIDGLENLINILHLLRYRAYRNDYFYEKMLP